MTDKAIGVGMIGLGTVGGGVAELLRDEAAVYAQRCGKPIELRRVLVRDADKARKTGLVDSDLVTDDPETFFAGDISVVVEVAGGLDPVGGYVSRALQAGLHVVTANKSLLAARGPELFKLARQNNASIAFEASCAGGIPCITAIQFGLMANRTAALYGILNGTCNFILSKMANEGLSYADVLAEAQQLGYAEADPTLDVSGADAAQKLAILASLAFGVNVTGEQVPCEGINNLQIEDIRFGQELGYGIKLLAIAEQDAQGRLSVGVRPCFLHRDELLADVGGAFNALSIEGHALGHSLYYGAGAGKMPTASAVVSDLLNVASGWYPHAFASMHLTPDEHAPAELIGSEDLVSRFYVRMNAMDLPGAMAQVTKALADKGISISAVLQHERNEGQYVPVVVVTHEAKQGDLHAATKAIEALDCINGEPVVVRIVDFDH